MYNIETEADKVQQEKRIRRLQRGLKLTNNARERAHTHVCMFTFVYIFIFTKINTFITLNLV